MKNLHLKIITPERILFEQDIKQVSIPTEMGEITILPTHLPLLSLLKSGELKIILNDGNIIPMVLSGGFIEVTQHKVLILADTAERIEELDIKRAEEAKVRAIERLNEKNIDAKDYAYLVAKIEKELARVKIGKKYTK